MNLAAIVTLLTLAVQLLGSTAGTPMQPQAIEFANQAVALAQKAITTQQQAVVTTPEIIPSVTAPVSTTTQQDQQITTMPEETKKYSIEVINPLPGKGLGRNYKSAPQVIDESNYIDIGAIIRNGDGSPVDNVLVKIEATDASQNRELNGTGNVTTIYVDGNKVPGVPYYPFHYEFKTAGQHKITITAEGVSQEITVEVAE